MGVTYERHTMNIRPRHLAPALLLATLTACSSTGYGASVDTTSTASSSSASSSSDTALATAGTTLGRIVVDGKQMTAYYFTKDTPGSGTSACTGECLAAWPPITSSSANPVVDGFSAPVATIALPGGGHQVTLDGRPLYRYAKDAKPGDTFGQGVAGTWFVIGPDGEKPAKTSTPAVPGY